MKVRARAAALVGAAAIVLSLSGCGTAAPTGSSGAVTLTLYNAQHEDLMTLLVDGFTKASGIQVQMRSGDDSELANQLVAEGDRSPADVFVTENSPAMDLVAGAGLFAPVDSQTVAMMPPQFAPSDHSWVGFAGRSTVLAYNTRLAVDELPASIMDLAKPQWQGRIGFSPAGADFQAIVSAVLALKGEPATQAWLAGLKANGKLYQGNTAVMKAVNDGQIDAGVIYHYYWFKDRAESSANSSNVALHYFGHQDPGAFVSVSGAGVLKTSSHQVQAQEFLAYLTGEAGQKILSDSAAMEYSLNPKVPANAALRPLRELDPPVIDPAGLNGPKVASLMAQAGLL